jgi:hypothetical protein
MNLRNVLNYLLGGLGDVIGTAICLLIAWFLFGFGNGW